MSELPGYDAWKLREPPGYEGAPPCVCKHEAYDHGSYNDNFPMPNEYFPGCTQCDCEDYMEYTREDYEDDMRERRAEARANW